MNKTNVYLKLKGFDFVDDNYDCETLFSLLSTLNDKNIPYEVKNSELCFDRSYITFGGARYGLMYYYRSSRSPNPHYLNTMPALLCYSYELSVILDKILKYEGV